MKIINKADLKKLIASNSKYTLIDVRNPDETNEGMIPTAHTIPLPELAVALQLDAVKFKRKYKFEKPSKEDLLIFYCRSGNRSSFATMIALKLGFNALNYSDSMIDWMKK
jgi:rhodanese-related sulfurtransferase